MAQPPAYNRQVDFTDRTSDQTDHPALNAELDDAAQAINLLRDNLAAIQRDDKSLRLPRAALRPDELSALAGQALAAASAAEDDLAAAQVAAQAAVTAAQTAQARVAAAFAGGQDRGGWSPNTIYQAGQIVWVGNTGYQAKSDHTSAATFAADFAAGKWVVFQGLTRQELADTDIVDLSLTDYTALRAYGGNKTRVYITGVLGAAAAPGISGVFVRHTGDTTSADNGGTVIRDALGRRWRRVFDGPAKLTFFGADPTGVIDSYPAFLATENIPISIPPGNYKTSGGTTRTAPLIGPGQDHANITATADIDHVFKVSGRNSFGGVYVNGGRKAKRCILFSSANGSILSGSRIEGAVYDNVAFDESSNNSNTRISDCLIRICGKIYTTGSATGSAGSQVLSISGAADLTTIGIRPGKDYIFLGSIGNDYPFEIQAVSPSGLTVYPPLPAAVSGSAIKIGSGANIYIGRNGDNSRIRISGNTFQSAPVGVQDFALYGAMTYDNILEYNLIGRVIGQRVNAMPTYDASDVNNYIEGQGVDYLYAYALGEIVRLGRSGQAIKQKVYPGSLAPEVNSSGAWVPVDGSPANLSLTSSGRWKRIGETVIASCAITYPITTTANQVYIGGLPFTQADPTKEGGFVVGADVAVKGYNAGTIQMVDKSGNSVPNSALSGKTISFTIIYTTNQP